MHIEITKCDIRLVYIHLVYRPGKKKVVCWLGYGTMKSTAGKDVNCYFGKQFSITL